MDHCSVSQILINSGKDRVALYGLSQPLIHLVGQQLHILRLVLLCHIIRLITHYIFTDNVVSIIFLDHIAPHEPGRQCLHTSELHFVGDIGHIGILCKPWLGIADNIHIILNVYRLILQFFLPFIQPGITALAEYPVQRLSILVHLCLKILTNQLVYLGNLVLFQLILGKIRSILVIVRLHSPIVRCSGAVAVYIDILIRGKRHAG